MPPSTTSHSAQWHASVEALCRGASALGPAVCALAGVRGEAHWSEDLAVIRSAGLMQVGGEGVVSAALASGLSVLPLGGVLLRLTLLNPLLAGFGAWLVFEIVLSLFPRQEKRALSSLVAVGAAWACGLSAAWQEAGTSLGGPLLAACLVLLLMRLLQAPEARRGGYSFAILAALLACESRWALPPVVFGGAAALLLRNRLPSLFQLGTRVLVFVAVVSVCLLPTFAEAFGGGDTWRLGLDLELPAVQGSLRPLAFDLDLYPVALALLASAWLAISGRGRRLMIPLVASALGALLLDDSANRLVLVALCAALSGRGFWAALTWLSQSKLPFRGMTQRLAVLVHLCAVLMVAEGGRQRVSRQMVSATRAWSEEAFDRLPANSLLLVNTPQAAWRLWAARLTGGARPDVVVIPSALLSHGALAEQLLAMEPQLHRLIRDVAAEGAVSEYALAELADTRPLRVEFDKTWTPRMLAHLVGDGLWFRFAPHAMGRSDRSEALHSVEASGSRILRAARTRHGRDDATLHRLSDDLLQHALVAAALGEKKSAQRFLDRLQRIDPDDERLDALDAAMDKNPRGVPNAAQFLVRRGD